jgi:nicotinamide phosphoribosyltransferase
MPNLWLTAGIQCTLLLCFLADTYTSNSMTLFFHCRQSLPGILAVKRVGSVPTVFPADSGDVGAEENLLHTVYNMRPVQVRYCEHCCNATLSHAVASFCQATHAPWGKYVPQDVWDTKFSDIRSRVASEWAALPKTADVISQPLKDKMAAVRAARGLQ